MFIDLSSYFFSLFEMGFVGLHNFKERLEWSHVVWVQVDTKMKEVVFHSFKTLSELLEIFLNELNIGAGRQLEMLESHHHLKYLLIGIVALVIYFSFIHFRQGVLSVCGDRMACLILNAWEGTLASLLLDLLSKYWVTCAFWIALWMFCDWVSIYWGWSYFLSISCFPLWVGECGCRLKTRHFCTFSISLCCLMYRAGAWIAPLLFLNS